MIHTLLAHAGEKHETTTEAATHVASEFVISTPLMFWLALLIIPAVLILVMKVMKLRISTILLILSTFLIIYSVVSYQHPGIYSAIALSVGFGIVLVQSMLGLSAE